MNRERDKKNRKKIFNLNAIFCISRRNTCAFTAVRSHSNAAIAASVSLILDRIRAIWRRRNAW